MRIKIFYGQLNDKYLESLNQNFKVEIVEFKRKQHKPCETYTNMICTGCKYECSTGCTLNEEIIAHTDVIVEISTLKELCKLLELSGGGSNSVGVFKDDHTYAFTDTPNWEYCLDYQEYYG